MDHSSAEVLAEFPERGLHWAKEQFETVLGETEHYVREKPAESLLCALVVGYILNRLPVGRILGGLFRLLIVVETRDLNLRRHQALSGSAGRRIVKSLNRFDVLTISRLTLLTRLRG